MCVRAHILTYSSWRGWCVGSHTCYGILVEVRG